MMNVTAAVRVSGNMETPRHVKHTTGSGQPQRAAAIVKNRALRGAAAATGVFALMWVLWPVVPAGEPPAAEKDRRAGSVSVRNTPPQGTPNGEPPLAPPAEGLESRLRRCYVSGFNAFGTLAESAAQLTAKVRVAERQPLTARVRDAGDAPVHLNFRASLPVWTLLEMMALQTGTAMELSGKEVVFSRAKKPVRAEGMLTRKERLATLRTLFAAAETGHDTDEFIVFESLVRDALGSNMLFEESSKSAAAVTGTPRDAEVLTLALNAAADQPAMMSLSVELISIPHPVPGVQGIDTGGLNGILSPEQIQEKLVPLRKAAGVQASVLRATIADPGDEVIVCTQLANRSRTGLPASLDVKFSVAPSDLRFCKLYSGISIEQAVEDNPANVTTQEMSSTTNLYFGQTLALGSFKQDDRHEVMIFVTPARADAVTASARR